MLFVEPGEIPPAEDVARLGQSVAAVRRGLYELMVQFAAYTGLRWGELTALTAAQVSPEARAVAVDRKVIEVRGQLYVEAPKNRKWRQVTTPDLFWRNGTSKQDRRIPLNIHGVIRLTVSPLSALLVAG